MQKFNEFKTSMLESLKHVSSDVITWVSVVVLHAATIPSLLAVMSGLTDNLPPIDLVFMVWAALTALFLKAAIQKDMLILVTIGLGFIVQSTMVALIFFK
jgi:hypothetical protein